MMAGCCSRWAAILAALLLAMPVSAAAQDSRALAQAYNQSGHELFRKLSAEPGNVVLSPLSIGTAMAMVLTGARGETEAEMRRVLRHSLSRQAIDAANAKFLAALSAAAPDAADATAQLRIANALMLVNPAATVADSYQDTIRTIYGAEIFKNVDLATVNAFVKDKTEGKIPSIIERLSPQDSHVLLNAVYFKAPWARPFARNATQERPFHLTRAETADVAAMWQSASFPVEKADGYRAIRLPYAREGLSMIVILPDAIDGIDTVMAGFDATKFERLLKRLAAAEPRPLQLSLPKFKFEFAADLIPPFTALGMSKVFDPSQSDLSGLTGLPREQAQSSIDQIAHRAVIEVAEEGTEAAAATAVVVTTRAMKPGALERFDVDRPFAFVIADDKTGAVLFMGRVSDPRR
ncbi:serpin family protein [Pseudorhodoplanes sp.]|uniref:serpin family protein n=1 Tax=Pseudorhodoplanes sp. TaxID=1934341 RepID=UPI00391CB094